LASRRGRHVANFGIGEGSRRLFSSVSVGRLAEGKSPQFSALVKGVVIGLFQSAFGVSRRIKRRDFSALRPKLRYSSYSMSTVPILRLLPQYEEVKGDNDGRGFFPQNLMANASTSLYHSYITNRH